MSSATDLRGNQPGWSPYVKVYDPLKAGSIDGTDLIPHDNAIVRAMSAEYNPPDERTITSNPVNTLFVGRLNLRTSERQLKDEFSQYGQVKSCKLVRDIITGMSRGYGFVEFRKEADAHRAWKVAHGSIFHERQILVEWEFSRTMPGWIPRRLGGGLGGKKESGQLRFGGRDRPFKRPLILRAEEDSPSISADFEHHHQIQDSSGHFRNELSKGKIPKSERGYEFDNLSRNVFDTTRKYKNYPDKKFINDDKNHKTFEKNDYRKYKNSTEGRSYYEEDQRGYRNDASSKFCEQPYYEEGRQKYKEKRADKYQSTYHDDKSKYRRSTENIYYDQGISKYEREDSKKSSYGYESTKFKRKTDDRYPDHLGHGISQTSKREFRERYTDQSHYYFYENESETNGNHSRKKYEDGDYYNNDYHSHKSSESYVSSKYERETDDKRGRHSANIPFVGPGSSKSESTKYEGPDLTQACEINLKRKFRSSSLSSSSSSSKSSSKRKHRRKHKKRSKKTDLSENDLSSCETGLSKKHKKSKKKKKKKKSRRTPKDDTDTD